MDGYKLIFEKAVRQYIEARISHNGPRSIWAYKIEYERLEDEFYKDVLEALKRDGYYDYTQQAEEPHG